MFGPENLSYLKSSSKQHLAPQLHRLIAAQWEEEAGPKQSMTQLTRKADGDKQQDVIW